MSYSQLSPTRPSAESYADPLERWISLSKTYKETVKQQNANTSCIACPTGSVACLSGLTTVVLTAAACFTHWPSSLIYGIISTCSTTVACGSIAGITALIKPITPMETFEHLTTIEGLAKIRFNLLSHPPELEYS